MHPSGCFTNNWPTLSRGGRRRQCWNPFTAPSTDLPSSAGAGTTASLSAATTIDELRQERGAYRIVAVDEAVAMASGGGLTLHPMCGGIPPDVAWSYLARVAPQVAPALEPPPT